LPLPSDYFSRLDFAPRSPDIIALDDDNNVRFVEVKREDRLRPGQLESLAFLRDLPGSEVEVVRVVAEGRKIEERKLACSYTVRPHSPEK